MQPKKLENLLLEEGVVEREVLEGALATAAREQKKLAAVLIETGALDERRLAEFVSTQTHLPLIEPRWRQIPPWVYRQVPAPLAREFSVVPLDVQDRRIVIAMLDPTDTNAIEVLSSATEMTVLPVVGLKSWIQTMLDMLYPVDVDVDATIISGRNLAEPGIDTGELQTSELAEPDLNTMAIEMSSIGLDAASAERETEPLSRPLDELESHQQMTAAPRRIDAALQSLRKILKRKSRARE